MEKKNQTPDAAFDHVRALVKNASAGSQDAFELLKARYKPLLESCIAKHTQYDMTAQDIADLRDEALTIFCNAVCNYDCTAEGVEFGLYAKICLENGLISFVRAYGRRRKKAVLPLETAWEKQAVIYDPLQAVVEKEDLTALVEFIQSHLSKYENRIWWMYVSGMSVSEISKHMGSGDAKSVSNAIYRIRKKLRGFIAQQKNHE